MKYTISRQGSIPPFTMDICGATSNRRGWSLRCIGDPGHQGDHISAYGLFWADGMTPYRLGPNQRRGMNGTPEELP